MKVAVLIPLYNHERYIGAAFDSLRAQTRPPDRVIVLDDGSTDQSVWAILRANAAGKNDSPGHRGSPIQTRTDILFQPNAGAHATINRLIALADDCDYLAILNSDDRYHPQRIERCLDYLEAHPEVDLLCTRLRLIDENGAFLASDSPRARWFSAAWSFGHSVDDHQPQLDLAEWLGLANFPGTTSNFFARARYLRANPFVDYRFAHDYYALVAAALENRLAVLDTELLDYRVHPANTINTAPEPLIREMLRLNLDIARRFGPRLLVEPELRAAFTRYQRATWSNVSGFRADLFNTLTVGALVGLPNEILDALPGLFHVERVPEITQYPNRALVNTHNPAAANALGPTAGLADKFYGLKAQLSAVRAAERPWNDYRQLQAALLGSRWFALGQVLGQTRIITRAGGKTAEEKLNILRERVVKSRWLRLGQRFGLESAIRVLELAEEKTSGEKSR